ncbi:MAG: LON peptidase substrate-binding domain-containing protein [Gemmatimonadaceae bacterium]
MLPPLLPLFPLGLVLFPGLPVPLHLFEPRYRQLLKDIEAGDRRFGIICAIPGVSEDALPAGRIGCVAEVTDVDLLPDGRSNIVVVGRERFALESLVTDAAPYLMARVAPVSDLPGDAPVALALAAHEVAGNFRRVVGAVHILNDHEGPLPELPDDPAQLPWSIAGMIDLDLDTRQRLLSDRSPAGRLSIVDAVLRKALPDLELRAAMHRAGSA